MILPVYNGTRFSFEITYNIKYTYNTFYRYLSTTQFIMNGFLKSQGYSKAAQFDPARPAESLSFLADAVFKRQFGLKVNSATYIKPAIAYLQVCIL